MSDDAMDAEREFNERNIAEFRHNGGKVGGQFEGFPLLLMTSTGTQSGAQRVNLIGYFDIPELRRHSPPLLHLRAEHEAQDSGARVAPWELVAPPGRYTG
jgi:hypothetical protein